jgi:hypothetical protein
MPVMLPPEAQARRLDLAAAPNELLRYVPIGPRVNQWREDDAELIEPVWPKAVS